jgi:hypothetical protein
MAVQQVSRQHVVSKVLLKRFAVPGRGRSRPLEWCIDGHSVILM